MKVHYLFVTPRTKMEIDLRNKKGPDTLLYGKNHLEDKHHVIFSDSGFKKNLWWLLCFPVEWAIIKFTGYGFKLSQAVTCYKAINNSDVSIGCGGSAGLPLAFLKWVGLIKRTKIILINIGIIESWDRFPKVIQWLYTNCYLQFDKILCFSEVESKSLTSSVGISSRLVSFIPLGIDTEFFRFDNSTPLKKEKIILSVGRDRGRDFNLLAESAKLLPGYKFSIITSPRNVIGLKPPPNVEIIFDIDYVSLREYYRKATVVVLPLKPVDRASGQLVILESLAMNKSVIVTKSQGALSGYPDLEKVITTAPSNPAGLALVIKKVIEKRSEANFPHTSELITSNYSSKLMADRLEKIILTISH